MEALPPGTILQRIYLRERIKKSYKRNDLKFCEVGGGNGINSNLLLNLNIRGVCYELNNESCKKNYEINKSFLEKGNYRILNKDFLNDNLKEKYDIIFSCMVIEHLAPLEVDKYLDRCKSLLNDNGVIISLAPAGMQYWGIEDEIAGHYKRYNYKCFQDIALKHNLKISHIAGLTYPLSNLLLPLSNVLVKKEEFAKKKYDTKGTNHFIGKPKCKIQNNFSKIF